MNQKGFYTVKEAVKVAWAEMPGTFYAINLINFVKAYTGRVMTYDSTILRKLRELRAEQPEKYNYSVINKAQSRYKKVG